MRALAALTSVVLGLALPVQAETLAQDLGPALWSGDARLGLYAIGQHRVPGSEPIARALVARTGLTPQTAPVRLRLVPGLAWDDNINGGLSAKTVELFGLTFTVDEESRAVAGVVGSVSLVGEGVFNLAPGLGLTAAGSVKKAQGEGFDFSQSLARLCLERDLGAWQFLGACLRQEVTARDMGLTEVMTPSVSWTQIGGPRPWALTLGVEAEIRPQGRRALGRIDWTQVTGPGLLTAGFTLGEKAEGYMALRSALSLGWRQEVLGAVSGISFNWVQEDGGEVFGTARRDGIVSVVVDRQIAPDWRVRFGVEQRVSTLDGFSAERVIFGVDWAGIGL